MFAIRRTANLTGLIYFHYSAYNRKNMVITLVSDIFFFISNGEREREREREREQLSCVMKIRFISYLTFRILNKFIICYFFLLIDIVNNKIENQHYISRVYIISYCLESTFSFTKKRTSDRG